jgi:pimeloyl-ACP methyl ester carboxylesterase
MSRKLFLSSILLVGILGVNLPAAEAAPRYRVVASTERRVGPLLVTEETVQVGDDPIDRFTLHRMRKPRVESHGALLLMPGGGSNFAFYTADDKGDELLSFAAFFALQGIDVWGYSPRTRGFALGACSGEVDCSGMRDWGMQSVVEDGLYIRRRIGRVYGTEKPIVGGISLGAMSTLALLNAAPDAWAGAVIWEGMLYSGDPIVRNANQVVCDELEQRIAQGELWDDATYPGIRFLYDLAIADPEGATPVPGFPVGFTNRQVYLAALTTPQHAPPAYVPGYTLAVGDLSGFTFAAEARLAMLILQLNAYDPLALVRDYTCALAGERTFTRNLPKFTAPVYVIGSGHAFGAWMGDNIDLLGSTDITRVYNPAFGHGDLFATPDHRRMLERPLLEWLVRVL